MVLHVYSRKLRILSLLGGLVLTIPGALTSQIPLDPGHGGKSILPAVLRPGDLILSSTPSWASQRIRNFTGGGPVSHARVYIGDGNVIESAPFAGVRQLPITMALAEDNLAVAFRIPGLTLAQERRIVAEARSRLGSNYDWIGAATTALFSYNGDEVDVNLGMGPSRWYFCTPLVLDSYRAAGVALTQNPNIAPNAVVPLTWTRRVEYVGHLRTP